MKYIFGTDTLQNTAAQTVVCFVPRFEKISERTLRLIDGATEGAVATLLESEEFTGGVGEMVTLYRPAGFKAERLLLLGTGESRNRTPDTYRRAMGEASRAKSVTSSQSVAVHLGHVSNSAVYQAVIEGYLLGSYKLLEYKTDENLKNKTGPDQILFAVEEKKNFPKLKQAVGRGATIAEGQLLVRELALTPSNRLTPQVYADRVRQLCRKHQVSCRVLDEKAISAERMEALLAVARGSAEPPRFMVVEYKGGPAGQKPIVLVGKGVTFDAGGISLKPALNMHEMKQDMTGSAVVLAAVLTASRLRIPRNIVALMPATENMPSGTATRPGDIVKSRKGKTIEIINTDSEGRLILADALDYANKFSPQAVIDVATLTGAALIVLGYAGAPIMSNNRKLADQLRAAADATSERVWEMPIWDDHREQMKSTMADLVNSGGRPGSTLTAGAFLENFIGDWPWAHVDIASVDNEPKGKPYTPRGATGFGLRLLIELLSRWKKV
ncbi:MAG TPA: leucyl aminopeptidase [Acidobacteriota bacterium]|nr:leucyl aminopeptidase [Acidobacteriota bacterium]